jgi:hypothetical protein
MERKQNLAIVGGLGLFALMLAGCWGGKDKANTKDDLVLLTINKKPVVTKTEFYKELGAMVGNKMDPMVLPKATQRKVLDDLAQFEATVAAAEKEGIAKDPEFVKAYTEQKRRLKKVALVRFYDKKKFDEVQVDESDARAHFDANKDRFVKEQGGILVSGVSFDSRDEALKFYEVAKRKDSAEDFASVGKKEKDGKFREFGRVGKGETPGGYNFVTVAIKTAAFGLTKLPAVDLIKDGKDTWVVHVSDKKEAVLYDYPEIADRIQQQLRVNKFMEIRKQMYEQLKTELNVEVNEEFFKQEPVATEPQALAAKAQENEGSQAV